MTEDGRAAARAALEKADRDKWKRRYQKGINKRKGLTWVTRH